MPHLQSNLGDGSSGGLFRSSKRLRESDPPSKGQEQRNDRFGQAVYTAGAHGEASTPEKQALQADRHAPPENKYALL